MKYFFGDKRTAYTKNYFNGRSQQEMLLHESLELLVQEWQFSSLVLANQVHGTHGIVINSLHQAHNFKPYSMQADFLITNVSSVALVVETADCAPIIAYDPYEQVIGIAHAGWPGTLAGIAEHMIATMQKSFGCRLENVEILFGPCASVSAYEVGYEFCDRVKRFKEHCLCKHDDRWYFNIPLYSELSLKELGVKNINHDHHACTIENHSFCSHRREPSANMRQLSLVTL